MNERKVEVKSCVVMDFSEFMTACVCEGSFLFEGFVFGFCQRGSLVFKVNYVTYEVSANGFLVVLPRRLFAVVSASADLDLKIFLLTADMILSLPVSPDFQVLKKTDACPCLQLADSAAEDIRGLCRMMERYTDAKQPVAQVREALMYAVVFIVSASFQQVERPVGRKSSRAEVLTRQFFDLLLEHYRTERTAAYYADSLCVTSKYLSTVVKQVTGYPLLSWVYDVVILAAKRYLKTTSLTIQQVSEALNFSTPSSFVRFFRQHTGYTPLEYRHQA